MTNLIKPHYDSVSGKAILYFSEQPLLQDGAAQTTTQKLKRFAYNFFIVLPSLTVTAAIDILFASISLSVCALSIPIQLIRLCCGKEIYIISWIAPAIHQLIASIALPLIAFVGAFINRLPSISIWEGYDTGVAKLSYSNSRSRTLKILKYLFKDVKKLTKKEQDELLCSPYTLYSLTKDSYFSRMLTEHLGQFVLNRPDLFLLKERHKYDFVDSEGSVTQSHEFNILEHLFMRDTFDNNFHSDLLEESCWQVSDEVAFQEFYEGYDEGLKLSDSNSNFLNNKDKLKEIIERLKDNKYMILCHFDEPNNYLWSPQKNTNNKKILELFYKNLSKKARTEISASEVYPRGIDNIIHAYGYVPPFAAQIKKAKRLTKRLKGNSESSTIEERLSDYDERLSDLREQLSDHYERLSEARVDLDFIKAKIKHKSSLRSFF